MNFDFIPFLSLLENIVDNRGKTCPTSEVGIPLIATNCVLNTHLYPVFDRIRYVDNETYDTWFRDHPKPGDILFVTKGTPGRTCWVPDPVNFCIAQDMLAIRANKELIYPKYLFALLRSSTVQKMIENLHVGTLIPHFKKSDFDKLLLPIPSDYKFQEKVGDLYFDICDKIELNRQINTTLEGIDLAIFQEWFVNFHFPGATGEMENSELGSIPKGWKVSIFEDELEADRGLSYKGFGLESGNAMPMHNLNSIYEGGGYKYDGIKYYSGEYKDRHVVKPGDLIVANTEQGHKYLLIGYPAIVPSLFGDTGIFSHHIYRLRAKQSSYLTSDYLYYLLLQPLTREQIIGFANGTTVNMLKIGGLQRPKFVLPPRELVAKFSELAVNTRLKQEENIKESQILSELRDTFIPKLMSGELVL